MLIIEIIPDALPLILSNIAFMVIKVVAALVLLAIGIAVSRLLGNLVAWVLKLIQVDALAKLLKVNAWFEKANIHRTVSELTGNLVYWLLAFIIVIGVAVQFNLPVDSVLIKIFGYMGIVFLAALILGLGVFLANVLSSIVRFILANLNVEGAKTVARVVYYIVIVFTFLAALSELGVSTDVFIPQIGVIIGAVGLAAAIAFGLGCKDMAADFLHNLFKGK